MKSGGMCALTITLSVASASCGNRASEVESAPNGGMVAGSGAPGAAGLDAGSSAGDRGGSTGSGGASGNGSAGATGSEGGRAAVGAGGIAGSGGGAGANGTAGAGGTSGGGTSSSEHWVGTWATGPQLTESANLPPAPGLQGNTLRQIVHASIGGNKLRLRLSNEFGDAAVTMDTVHVAASIGGGSIDARTDLSLTFSGASSVTMQAGKVVNSDPFDYALAPLSDFVISIHFASTPSGVTGHPGSRATSYLESGNAVSSPTLATAATTEHWYFIAGLDVVADAASAALVVLGDSITDGRGSTTNGNNRWPDDLAQRLHANAATVEVGVLNQGIGGNAVLSGGLGPPALQRFQSDVLSQTAARWLIVLEGVNDLGSAGSSAVANSLTSAYQRFIAQAHQQGMLAYGIPILPFGGSQYDSAAHESARQTVNAWIRTSGQFDQVIDLETVVRDPAKPSQLFAAYDSGDHLHLNGTGYQKMADAVDLSLFAP